MGNSFYWSKHTDIQRIKHLVMPNEARRETILTTRFEPRDPCFALFLGRHIAFLCTVTWQVSTDHHHHVTLSTRNGQRESGLTRLLGNIYRGRLLVSTCLFILIRHLFLLDRRRVTGKLCTSRLAFCCVSVRAACRNGIRKTFHINLQTNIPPTACVTGLYEAWRQATDAGRRLKTRCG